MHPRYVSIILAICLSTSCAVAISRPPSTKPVVLPPAAASCTPLPEGLKLYAGIPFAEVERAGKFPMQHPERRFLKTSNHLWVKFREGLRPTDVIFEYVHDEKWERGTMHHGGISAFREQCTLKLEQVWTT